MLRARRLPRSEPSVRGKRLATGLSSGRGPAGQVAGAAPRARKPAAASTLQPDGSVPRTEWPAYGIVSSRPPA